MIERCLTAGERAIQRQSPQCLVGSKVFLRKDHLARQSMKIKNRRKTVSLWFRAVVKSVDYHARGDPTDELRVDPADATTAPRTR